MEIEDQENSQDFVKYPGLRIWLCIWPANPESQCCLYKRKVSEEIAEEVRRQNLAGITFTEESKRFYPKGNLASHILGFAGIDSQGLEGLELSYDKYLRGKPGKIGIERDAAGRFIPDGIQQYVAPHDGYNIYLTIDEVIQYIVERELDKAMTELQTSDATVIVMDPKTGESWLWPTGRIMIWIILLLIPRKLEK